jgi:hypothetical protein
MAEPGAELEGMDELVTDVGRLSVAINQDLAAKAQQAGNAIVSGGAARLPVITGTLASSLAVDAPLYGDDGTVTVDVYSNVIYFGPVEYGGWPPSRPYIPEGRYVGPITSTLETQFPAQAERTVTGTVDGFGWSHTATT